MAKKRLTHQISNREIIDNIGNSEQDETKRRFATNLNELLAEKEKSQKELAQETNIKESSISDYRNGNSEPKITSVNSIAKSLGVSVDYLLGNTDVKSTDMKIREICRVTGLNEQSLAVLMSYTKPKNKKTQYLSILNLLFASGMIDEFLELIDSNIQYLQIYNNLQENESNQNIAIKSTLDKNVDFINWTHTEKLSSMLHLVTEMLAEAFQSNCIISDYTDENIVNINKQIDKLKIFHMDDAKGKGNAE